LSRSLEGVNEMKLSRQLAAQIRSCCPTIALILVASAVPLGTVLFLHSWKGIPIRSLTRDITYNLDAPLYIGFLSQLSILLWSAAAAICLFGSKVLPRESDGRRTKQFLFVSGLLTVILCLDDAFLLHEDFFPRFGIPEEAMFGLYAVLVLFFLFRYYALILTTEYLLLGMAIAFFGFSVIVDLLRPQGINRYFLEDGAKLIGIITWLVYFFRVGAFTSRRNAYPPSAVRDRESSAISNR